MKYFLENLLIPYLKDILLTPLLLKIAIKHLQNTENLESLKSININGRVKTLKKDQELILLPSNAQIFSKYKVLEFFMSQCHTKRKQKNETSDLQISFEEFQNNLKLTCLNDLNEQSQLQSLILKNNQEGFSLEISELSSSTNSKLITFNNNQVQFLHQQILDFFIAQKILKYLQVKNEITNFLNNEQVNLSQKQNEQVVELLIDRLKNDEFRKKNLKEVLKLSINDKSKVRASSNGIFLLSKMGACLENENFKGIIIENTSMIGLNSINCDFTECKIKNVDIDFCNLNCCKFMNSEFQNASCCEFPEIQENEEVLQVISFKQDQQLAVLKQNGKVNIWNVEAVERDVEIENIIKNKYKQIIISKDDSTLIALTDYQIEFWNLNKYVSTAHISFISKSKYMFLSPDNTLLICNSQNQDIEKVKYTQSDQIWRKQQIPLSLKQDAVQMAINHSNELLVVRNTSNQIKFFNLSTSNEIIITQQISGNAFTSTADGERLIIQHKNQIDFYQFEISNGTLNYLKHFNISKLENPKGLYICQNSEIILIQGQNQTKIFYERTQQLQQLPKRFYGENSVLSRNGEIFINWKDNKVQLWDLKSLNKTKQKEEIDDYVKCCQYSPDGQKLLIVSSKKTLFYNIDQKIYHWIFESIYSFCFHPTKEILVTFSKQGLKFWRINTEHQLISLPKFDIFQEFEVQKLIFSQNGEWLVFCNKNIVSIMNVLKVLKVSNQIDQLENIIQIPGFNYNEKDQFNFSKNLLQYSFDNQQLLKFNPQEQKCEILQNFDSNCEAQTFSPTGKYIAYGEKSEKKNFITYKVQHEINAIYFSNNEKQLYFVTQKHTEIQIYFILERNSIRMLQQMQVIKSHRIIRSLSLHPKNVQFLVVGKSGEILFYNKKQDQNEYEMCVKMGESDELCSLNSDISLLRITSNIKQQNLRLLLLQKGAKTQPINA
ncbi:unnamed protein product (macronuclear) [Paramecium tetraurelia]|uniref:Cilia- and flagella-associated protein 52 n=1 Tax=Paramecium tetraurelia TaxID=5888 RepID=A0BGB4_PARTE|nr:uncharacterized protein GSPATT00028616001 [Paramecium tetraurelia]CAK57581.1 unnamed protein product [Paramecium tetraurelia]|eukprot:XP_001424979.1 hypothetical protein (macronuclear) [Paramecium tetraurelia strain d4-2]